MARRSTTLFVCGALLLAAAPAAAGPTASVADIKAAYLLKFGPFIEWKQDAPAPSFPICVVGENEVSKELDREAAGQKVNDAPVEIRHLSSGQAAAGCRILYFAQQAADNNFPSVLTVTDTGETPRGVISFVIEHNHVRFDVNVQAASKAGLAISAKLLGLAHAVEGAP
ncbi:MAG TPA: YfiR family protein [Rhizomicrobium sp.]|nr:YfiR family protein [Rhizomicrobium sp.]